MPLVLGVDSSTQSTKVEVRDADTGELVASGRAPHPPTSPPRSEQDPSAWWDALRGAVEQLDVAPGEIAAVSVAGQQHGMVVLDAQDHVVRPAKLWNDTESAPDARWLIDHLAGAEAGGGRGRADRCRSRRSRSRSCRGCTVPSPTPGRASRASACRTTGSRGSSPREFVTDRGDASGTGYFSAARDEYQLDLLALVDDGVDWSARLPRVLGPTEPAGETRAFGTERDRRAGHRRQHGGGGRARARARRRRDLARHVGHRVRRERVGRPPIASGAVAGFADATGRFLPLVCTLNATKVTDTVAGWLGVDHEGLDALALAAPPGAGGVVLVPYFDGERIPNRPGASGAAAGLRTATTREHLARAAIEGVVCGLLDGLDALTDAGIRTDGNIVLVGGGARSHAYQRVLADLAGRPVVVPDESEHVAAGACIQAAAVLRAQEITEVAREWDLARGALVEPRLDVDRAAVRDAYAEARGERL